MRYKFSLFCVKYPKHAVLLWFVLMLGAMAVWASASGIREVLDDSKSPKKQYNTQLKWVHQSHTRSMDQDEYLLLEGIQHNVEVWLDTKKYKGRNARIYLGLPHQIEGFSSAEHFILRWRARSTFIPGEVRPGNRSLIYDGSIDRDLMIDLFTFTLRVHANYLTGKLRYVPVFEIEPY